MVYEMGTVGGFDAQSGLASQPTLTTAPVDVLIALLKLPPRFTMEDVVAVPKTPPLTVAETVDEPAAEIVAPVETSAQLLILLLPVAEVVNALQEPKLAPARATCELPVAVSVHWAMETEEKSGPWMHTAALPEAITPSVPDVAAAALVTKICDELAAIALMLPTSAVNNCRYELPAADNTYELTSDCCCTISVELDAAVSELELVKKPPFGTVQ